MTRICFINQKGGCGKSSTCFHLAGAMANQGLAVLLVDADPQGSLSQGFFGPGIVENLDSQQTVAAMFAHDDYAPDLPTLIRPTEFDGIAVIPANQSLSPFNVPQPERLGLQQFVLLSCLDQITGFDFVLIDCPPNLYQCTWSALLAADYVIIPVPPEDFGTQGLPVVHQAIEHAKLLNPSLELLGHLVTRSDSRLLVHRTYEQRLRQLYGASVFHAVIPEAVAFKVSLACRQPVEYFSPRSNAARLTKQLSREILDHVTVQTASAALA